MANNDSRPWAHYKSINGWVYVRRPGDLVWTNFVTALDAGEITREVLAKLETPPPFSPKSWEMEGRFFDGRLWNQEGDIVLARRTSLLIGIGEFTFPEVKWEIVNLPSGRKEFEWMREQMRNLTHETVDKWADWLGTIILPQLPVGS